MAKKKLGLEDLGGFVFSTNKDFSLEAEQQEETTLAPEQQQLEAYLDKKSRGGKTVTVIKGFEGTLDDLKQLAKQLKKTLWSRRKCERW